MAGTLIKSNVYLIKAGTARYTGGMVIAQAGTPVAPVTTQVTLGLPSGQKIGTSVTNAETNATIAGDTDSRATYKPYSAGTYAGNYAGQYVIVQANSQLAGVASTLLKNPAGEYKRNSINTTKPYNRSMNVSAINYITGALTSSAKTYYWRSMSAAASHPETGVTTQVDQATVPNITRAIPGEFTISETGKIPTNKDYDAKTD